MGTQKFRELIVRYIQNNADEYIYPVADDDINITEADDEKSIFLKKRNFILNYAIQASNEGINAGDIEIAKTCVLLNCTIRRYILNDNGYKLIFEYNNKSNNENQDIDIINILFINNNHFNLLIKKQERRTIRNNLLENKIDIKDLEKLLNIKSKPTNVKIKENLN